MHKRKHRKPNRDGGWEQDPAHVQSTGALDVASAPDPCLYIQAHEADVIRGPPAMSARLLECQDTSTATGSHSRSGLIRWGPPESLGDVDTVDTQRLNQPALLVDSKGGKMVAGARHAVQSTLFDVRLLLDHLPDLLSENTQVRLPSPSGWSDLPSDSEDTFFFSPDELEDYRREKRRKLVDRGREERLRALELIDAQEQDSDPWGGSDEEPDEAQRDLIRRTAAHIISSPNPAQLEMRILANYGTDKRFAFLRGRWSRVWRTEKERAKQYQAEEAKKIQPPTALASLGGLSGYGDSDTDGEDSESADKLTEEPRDDTHTVCTRDAHSSEDVVKEARRARAKEWSARRRAEQSKSQSEQV